MDPKGYTTRHLLLPAIVVVLCVFACSRLHAREVLDKNPRPSPFSDFRTQSPGTVHHIKVGDLPLPDMSNSPDNGPSMISRPANAWPKVPPGFRVDLYAAGLKNPRLMRTAPNGDVFLAESHAGTIVVFRGVGSDGKAVQTSVYATNFRDPFGIAFYPPGPSPKWIYIANTDSVVRFPYQAGDLKARDPPQTVASVPGGGLLRGGGHWTRDVAFSSDGQIMFVSVGSHSNVDDTDDNPAEKDRADILAFTPEGKNKRVFAWGIRNAVGIAVNPMTGQLWASVNERDRLGDNLVPDYITHVEEGGFYGWPWWYMGGSQDPRHKGKHPELRDKVITPDVILQPHNASLEMLFYDGTQFPAQYKGDIFASEHGSWNRRARTGYEVIRVPLHGRGKASGEYEDFLTGFVTPEGDVWGRPVGIAVAKDGSLLVSDDGGECVWRVSYLGK
jgi:glucose/arabinose dehydrogenase